MTVSVFNVSLETIVNADAPGPGYRATDVIPLANGSYVVTWDGYARPYSVDGAPLAPATSVTALGRVQGDALADGGYVLVWSQQTGSFNAPEIFAQRYDSAGVAAGAAFVVNTTLAGSQLNPSVAGLADGGFVAAWQSFIGGGYQTLLQRYDAQGAPVGGEMFISGRPGEDSTFAPNVVALEGGGYVIAWTSQSSSNLVFEVFNAAGASLSEIAKNGLGQSVSALPGGGFVTAWTTTDNGAGKMFTQVYDASGTPVGAPTTILDAPSDFGAPSIAVSPDGGYTLIWEVVRPYPDSGLFALKIDASGQQVGQPSELVTTGTYRESGPHAATVANGDVVVAWTVNASSAGGDIYQQRISAAPSNILSQGMQWAVGDDADDTFQAPPGLLGPSDQVDGRGGFDTVALTAAGTLNFTGVALTSVERVLGSAGDDTFVFAGSAMAGVAFDSGGGSDTLQFTGAANLSGLSLTGNWTLTSGEGQTTLTLGSLAQLPLIQGGAGPLTVDVGNLTLDAAQRQQLFQQGVTKITNGDITYTPGNRVPWASDVFQPKASSGETIPANALTAGLAAEGYVMAWGDNVQRFHNDGSLAGPVQALPDTSAGVLMDRYVSGVTGLEDGGFVVTWYQGAIYSQRFDSNGVAVGAHVKVSAATSGQIYSRVADLADGGYVVSWVTDTGSSQQILAQRFDSDDARVGGEFVVNTTLGFTGNITSIDGLSDGGFVVVWSIGHSPRTIYSQRYDSAGQKEGGETAIDAGLVFGEPVVVALAAGYAVVTGDYDGQEHISVRVYDNDGHLVGSSLKFGIGYSSHRAAATFENGEFIVAWSDTDSVNVQRFSSTGQMLGSPQTFASGSMPNISVSTLPNDGYVLTYAHSGVVRQQIFTEYVVHTLTTGADLVPADTANTLVEIAPGTLNDTDSLRGGTGENLVRLSQAGSYDFDAPGVFEGFQRLTGSSGDDSVSGSLSRLAQFSNIDGGAGTDEVRLTTAGTINIGGFTNIERFVGSDGFDRVVLGDHRIPGMTFDSGGGGALLVVSGFFDLGSVDFANAWTVGGDVGEAVTLKMTSYGQMSLPYGPDSTVTVDASGLSIDASQRAALFQAGVDYIVQDEAVFTPGGALSRARPVAEVGSEGVYTVVTTPMSNGGYLAVWQLDTQGPAANDIMAQIFDAHGAKVGAAFLVNTTTAGHQYNAEVTTLSSGAMIVVWTSAAGTHAQRLDAAGAKVGGELLLSPASGGTHHYAEVTALSTGGYVVSWQLDKGGAGGDEIHFRRYDASGAAIGSEETVTGPGIDLTAPVAASLSDGGFVLSWSSRDSNGALDGDVYLQRYDSAGAAVGGRVHIDAAAYGAQDQSAVAGLSDGGYVVAWKAGFGNAQPGVFIQRYDASGVAVGEKTLVNTSSTGASAPQVIGMTDGGLVVSWNAIEGGYAQRFNADGYKIGGEILVIAPTPGSGTLPVGDLTAMGDGFLASGGAWRSFIKAFTPLQHLDLTPGSDTILGDGRDIWVTASLATLNPGDNLNGGPGAATLELLGSGLTVDLTALAGFSGFERLVGSAGDDVWLVSAARLVGITDIAGGDGNDTIALKAPGVLDLSQMALSGIERIKGSVGDDILTGSAGADLLDGGPGDDQLEGGGGNDTASYLEATSGVTVSLARLGTAQATGGAGTDTLISIENLTGSAFDDALTGNAIANILIGAAGDDMLDGGAGSDRLYGGVGDDTYRVNVQGDLVFEFDGQGVDTVITTGNYYLYEHIENLTLAADAGNIFGVGNGLDNLITGNTGNNLLLGGGGSDAINGGAGDDRLFGESGNDLLDGGAGADQLVGGAGNDLLGGGDGADSLYGEDGADTLIGGASGDMLIGGAGNDTLDGLIGGAGEQDLMDGGAGDDHYLVDAADDLTFEAANGGTDRVTADFAGGTYYLYANVENLTLAGTTTNGVGNELDNVVTGNSSANWLLGGAGNDTLNGKAGGDVLFGQEGADTFVFELGTGGDVIGDFAVGVDKVKLTGIYSSFAEVQSHMVQNGSDSAILFGDGDLVVFQNVAMNTFTANDFLF